MWFLCHSPLQQVLMTLRQFSFFFFFFFSIIFFWWFLYRIYPLRYIFLLWLNLSSMGIFNLNAYWNICSGLDSYSLNFIQGWSLKQTFIGPDKGNVTIPVFLISSQKLNYVMSTHDILFYGKTRKISVHLIEWFIWTSGLLNIDKGQKANMTLYF